MFFDITSNEDGDEVDSKDGDVQVDITSNVDEVDSEDGDVKD